MNPSAYNDRSTFIRRLAYFLIGTAIVFHGILWARNAAFLWSRRRTILAVILIAELWQLVTDPIGAIWGAWRINPDQVLGIWLYGVGITPIDNLLGIALVSSAAGQRQWHGHHHRRSCYRRDCKGQWEW